MHENRFSGAIEAKKIADIKKTTPQVETRSDRLRVLYYLLQKGDSLAACLSFGVLRHF